jgi:hypothetical protein
MDHAAPVTVRDLRFQKFIRYDQGANRRPKIAVAGSYGLCDGDL